MKLWRYDNRIKIGIVS